MYSGGVYIIDIEEEYKDRLYNWVENGNKSSSTSPLAVMGLNARAEPITKTEHLLVLQHNLFFNFSFPLKLIFILQARKIRKHYTIRTAKKRDLINYMEAKLWGKKKY